MDMSKYGKKVDVSKLVKEKEKMEEQKTVEEGIPESIKEQMKMMQISDTRENKKEIQKTKTPIASNIRETHPVLKQLKLDLGILEEDVEDITIGGHVWSMVPLTQDDLSYALFLANKTSYNETDLQSKLTLAIISLSIRKIDGVSVIELMEVKKEKDETEIDQKKFAAYKLMQFLSTELSVKLCTKLNEAYVQRIDKKKDVVSMLDPVNVLKITYNCPEDNCDNIEYMEVPLDTAEENYPVVFCKKHGSQMVAVEKERFDTVNPLS